MESDSHITEHDDPDDVVHSEGGSFHHASEHAEGSHGEPWLVSYADMMTLLFGFFVLMYSFEAAKYSDDKSVVKMRKELAQFFGGGYVNPLQKVASEYKEQMQSEVNSGLKDVKIEVLPEGLEITFQSTILFDPGHADLNPGAIHIVQPLVDLIKGQGGGVSIRVEGYTDDNPINSEKYPSNWELSAARAATVLRLFESAGFNPEKLTALGYGSTRPALPNRNSSGQPLVDNQARNRRVKIFVTNSLEAGAQAASEATPAAKVGTPSKEEQKEAPKDP